MKFPHSFLNFMLLLPVVIVSPVIGAQTLQGQFCNCDSIPDVVTLYSFFGTETTRIDKAEVDKNGKFNFTTHLPNHAGYYRLAASSVNYTDIILLPGDQIKITFKGCRLKNWDKVKGSRNNQLLLESMRISAQSNGSVGTLEKIAELANKNSETYFAKTTLAYLPVEMMLPDTFYKSKKSDYAKKHAFDKVDFSNPEILYSTVLPNIYMRYLERHTNYDESGFKQTVDFLLKQTVNSKDIRLFTLNFLIDLFAQVGPEIILEYLVENYFDETFCIDQQGLNVEMNTRISNYLKLKPGQQLDEFRFKTDSDLGDSLSLSEICTAHHLTLIVFWSSYCHFCSEKSPEWKKLAEDFGEKGLGFLYFSLDTDYNEWKTAIQQKKLTGHHSCELTGWQSAAAQHFLVNKTPYVILVDKTRKILLKDPTSNQLVTIISNYLK